MSNGKRIDIWSVVRTILEKSPKIKAKKLIQKIQRQMDLSRSTIYEHLHSFELRGQIYREKGWYWLPQSVSKEGRATLAHSRQLSLGFEAVLAEDWTLYRFQEPSKERARWRDKIELKGSEVKEFAIEHLTNGYPSTYEKMKRWRKLKESIRKELLKDGHSKEDAEAVLDFATFVGGGPTLSEECQKLFDERIKAYQTLEADIRLIILRIEAGNPIRGTCRLCTVKNCPFEKQGR